MNLVIFYRVKLLKYWTQSMMLEKTNWTSQIIFQHIINHLTHGCSTAEASIIDMLYIETNKPRTQGNILICIPMKYVPNNNKIWLAKGIMVNNTKWNDLTFRKGSPVYWNIGCQIFGDCIYLPCRMPKILISLLTEFPVFWFMVLNPSAHNGPGKFDADICKRHIV